MNWHWSPFMVPLGAFAVAIVAIVSGIVGEGHKQRLKADQRMAMIAKGMTAQDIDTLLGKATEDDQREKDSLRSLGTARRTAIVLIATGLGLSLFGLALTWIVQEHDVLVVAAVGLIPLVIGVGFVVDYHLQKRELARFGLEVGQER